MDRLAPRRDAEGRLERAVECVPTAIAVIDPSGRIHDVNARMARLFGYAREELLGRPLELLVPQPARHEGGDRSRVPAECWGGPPGAVREVRGRRKDGGELPVEIEFDSTVTPQGVLVLASIRDVSERKRAEALIQARNQELETLLHVASHDLREPLRAIETFSQMVSRRYADRLDAEGRDLLLRIERAGGRMQRLLDDLLLLSRVRRSEIETEAIDARQVVDAALDRLEAAIRRSGGEVQVGPDLPQLLAERTWATQAIYNLLSNALKFTRPGERPRVEIAAYRERDGPHAGVGIVVRDRGPGVKAEHAERIFGLFQRAVGPDVEGTGAGLAIARQVAQRFGGRAWVQPRDGGGSEFVITFAAAEGSPAEAGQLVG